MSQQTFIFICSKYFIQYFMEFIKENNIFEMEEDIILNLYYNIVVFLRINSYKIL